MQKTLLKIGVGLALFALGYQLGKNGPDYFVKALDA